MLPLEGKEVLNELYPFKFSDPECEDEVGNLFNDEEVGEKKTGFLFSTSWIRSFLRRYDWSLRRVTNKKNWKLEKELGMKLFEEFHINTRPFNLPK